MNRKEKIVLTINARAIALNQRKFTTSEIGRGIGAHKIKKGKGSYNRKSKNRRGQDNFDLVSFFKCHSKIFSKQQWILSHQKVHSTVAHSFDKKFTYFHLDIPLFIVISISIATINSIIYSKYSSYTWN